MTSIHEQIQALASATITDELVYHVEGYHDEFQRGRHTVGYTLDQETAKLLAKGEGFYCDGIITTMTRPVAKFDDGNMVIVSISYNVVHPDMLSFEERKKKELQAKAIAKLTKEEREALGL